MKQKIKQIYKNFLSILKLPEMQVLPGQLSFNILMSFVPILTICTMILSYLSFNLNFIEIIKNYLPDALENVIIPFLNNSNGVSNSSVFVVFILYFITAINGAKSIIITSNRLYKEEKQSNIALIIKALFMTIILIILLIFIIIIPILGDIIVKFIFKELGSPDFLFNYKEIYEILKFLISFIFIYIFIKILYTLSPKVRIKSKTTTSGALFTTISWIIATEIFAFYITNIARYNVLYGNFANILILLIWIYLLAYLFVVGIALNINNYNTLKTKEVDN